MSLSKWSRLALPLLAAGVSNAMTVAITPSKASPVPVGTQVTFTAAVSGNSGTTVWFRFRVRRESSEFQLVRDYGPVNALDWTASKHEGTYEIEVSARDVEAGDQATATLLFQFQSLVSGGQPTATPTSNSLVFLYGAPACDSGSRMRVQFQPAGAAAPTITQPLETRPSLSRLNAQSNAENTPWQACAGGLSMNFYLAGMTANTNYVAHHVIDNGTSFATGPGVNFTTGDLPAGLYTDTILMPSHDTSGDGILLGGPIGGNPVANDLAGNVLWYGPAGMTFLTRVEAGGEFWAIAEAQGDSSQQILRKYDLAGMTLLETNAARINEQLKALGKPVISGFHHEARPISGGRIAVLAGLEQIVNDAQGPGAVDVLGDMIVVLDQNLNVVWTWNTFDNLDVHRTATLGEVCPNAGCPAIYLAPNATDWTHGNALQQTADGNLLYSTRNQDWLIKISYDGGDGDGHILWRLGNQGDFTINSTDAFPWFSHQHDGNFQLDDPTRLMVFDDGNTRVAQMKGGNSRGQVYALDEQQFVATPVLNADLGVYSEAVGSAQRLLDGNYHFDAGFVSENNTLDAYSLEVNPAGSTVYEAHQNVTVYRSFRMTDMYTPQ